MLSTLKQKLQYNTPDRSVLLDEIGVPSAASDDSRASTCLTLKPPTPACSFACLVAERCQGERATVGIADVSLQGDKVQPPCTLELSERWSISICGSSDLTEEHGQPCFLHRLQPAPTNASST